MAKQIVDASFFDPSNEDSLINRVSASVAEKITAAINMLPELVALGEDNTARALKKRGYEIDSTLAKLRISFWEEYELSLTVNRSLNLTLVYGGICSFQTFQRYLSVPEAIFWLICPTTSYKSQLMDAHYLGMKEMREILNIPLADLPEKKFAAIANLKVKIAFMLDNRLKGSIVQKIEAKTFSVTQSMDVSNSSNEELSQSMQTLTKRLQELEGRDVNTTKAIGHTAVIGNSSESGSSEGDGEAPESISGAVEEAGDTDSG